MSSKLLAALMNNKILVENAQIANRIKIWIFSDPHTPSDNDGPFSNPSNPNNIQLAYSDIAAAGDRDYDIAICPGDFFNAAYSTVADGQYVSTNLNLTRSINRLYAIKGNHDEVAVFDSYVDPMGLNTATSGLDRTASPYPITGDIDKYYIKIGNIIIVFVGDYQAGTSPMGESDLPGGKTYNAAGGYSTAQWAWLTELILSNLDCNIILITHHPIRNTTVGSGFQESVKNGFTWDVGLNGQPDHEVYRNTYMAYINNEISVQKFDDYYKYVASSLVCYIHGHIHTGIDETVNGRTWYETKYGTKFINVCPLAKGLFYPSGTYTYGRPHITNNSKMFTIQDDTITMKTYVHSDVGGRTKGYQGDLEKTISLPSTFIETYVSSDPSAPSSSATISNIDVATGGHAKVNIGALNGDGILIVRKSGGYATFTPSVDTIYLRGDACGDGEAVFIGTITGEYDDYGLLAGTYYYSVYNFNGSNNKIAWYGTPAQSTATVTAGVINTELGSKILAWFKTPDSSTNVTLDGSNNVSQWNDDSGNALHFAQATSGNRPAYASNRIAFTTNDYLQIPYSTDLVWHDGTYTIDRLMGIFIKVKMTDATQFRILSKVSAGAGAAEWVLTTDASDKLFFAIYTTSGAHSLSIISDIALTAYEGQDLYIFVNYLGGHVLKWGGCTMKVYDSSKALIALTTSTITAVGTFSKLTNQSLPLDLGRSLADSTYAEGEINGVILTKNGIIEDYEIPYILDNY